MAKEIELAFSAVRNHKTIKTLRAVELGAYVALTQSCLLDGFDPLPADRDTLQLLSKTSPAQWGRSNQRIMAAFNATIGVLKALYEQRAKVRATRQRIASIGHESTRLRRRTEKSDEKETHSFVELQANGASLLQPQKSAQTYAQNYKRQTPTTSHVVPLTD